VKRIGPQMKAAVNYVLSHQGCCMRRVAEHLHIGARKGTNNALGYSPVHRAIKAGLIQAGYAKGRYVLTVQS